MVARITRTPSGNKARKGGVKMANEMQKASSEEIAAVYAAIKDGEPLPVARDPELITRQILERIMAADTFEEAFAPQTIPSWAVEFMDEPVIVQEFKLNPSTYEQGSSVYAVCDIVHVESGELYTVSIGGRNVLVQLVKMLEMGWMDNPVKLSSKKTAEGFSVLWLVPA